MEQVLERRSNQYQETYKKETIKVLKPALAEYVENIRAKGKKEEESFLLPGTGFNVSSQIERLSKNLHDGLENRKGFQEILDGSFQQVEQDVQGFVVEYLMEGVLFPIVLDRGVIDGKERIVGAFYDHKPWVDTITTDERNGAVKRALAGDIRKGTFGVEDFLLSAKPGSIAVMTSPPGWSGLFDSDGQPIKFPYSQTYIFQVQKDGRPRGFTVKTDMRLDENEELLRRLKAPVNKEGSYQERIVKVVENVVFIDASEGENIEDIVGLIKDIKKSNTAFVDTNKNVRYFDEAYKDLQNPEKLWTLNERTQKSVDEFREYVEFCFRNGIADQRNFQIALGVVLLKLSDSIRRPGKQSMAEGRMHELDRNDVQFDPRRALEKMQEVGGCNGGGKKKTQRDSISPREISTGESILEEDEYGSLEFDCPHADCGKKNRREPHKLLENCQHCGKSVRC